MERRGRWAAHVTILGALRLLGLGTRITRVAADEQGRMRADAFRWALEATPPGPVIVCAQAGNVNTGAFDPLEPIVEAAHARGAWVHVDGAFGLWAAASPALWALVAGAPGADSWCVDAHKWLNVPYDCGIAICAHPAAHRAAMVVSAAYLVPSAGAERDGLDWAPEFSRRARGVTVYAALRTLGREGVRDLVERCCGHARRFAAHLGKARGVRVLNDVVLNQVLVRFDAESDAAGDARTREVVRRVQEDGTCWLSGTTWHDMAAMRISVVNWSTTEEDVDRSLEAILRAAG